jgi:hypothetical protein
MSWAVAEPVIEAVSVVAAPRVVAPPEPSFLGIARRSASTAESLVLNIRHPGVVIAEIDKATIGFGPKLSRR